MQGKLIAELRELISTRRKIELERTNIWKGMVSVVHIEEILSRHEAEQGEGVRDKRMVIDNALCGLASIANDLYQTSPDMAFDMRTKIAHIKNEIDIERKQATPTKPTEPLAKEDKDGK